MEGNCRKGFVVVWFLYLSTCEGKWNGSQKVLMLEDNGSYLVLSALSLFLLLDLFADLLPCSSSGRYFSPVSTPPLLEDQLLGSWNWPTTTLGHLFHTPELCQKGLRQWKFLEHGKDLLQKWQTFISNPLLAFLNDRPACQTKAKMEDEKFGKTLVNIQVDSLEPRFLDLVWISPEQRCWFQLLDCHPTFACTSPSCLNLHFFVIVIKGSSGFASCWSASQPKLFWDWSLSCSVACQIIFRQLPWNSHFAQINVAKWHGPLDKQCSYTSAAWVQQPNPSLQRAFVVFESTQAGDVRACPTAEHQ